MKIVIARRDSLTHVDGVSMFIANLAKGLRALGHEVALMSWGLLSLPRNYSSFEEFAEKVYGLKGVEVITIVKGIVKSHREPRVSIDWLLWGGRALRKWGADAVIINGVVPLTFRPRLIVLHDVSKFASRFKLSVYRALYNSYDLVTCMSEKARLEAEGAGIRCDAVTYSLVDLTAFSPRPLDERKRLVVHIGTRGVKNLDVSIAAIKLLRDEGYDLKLAVVGAEASSSVRRILGYVPDWIEPLDYISQETKADLLSRALALLLPSSHEAFSLTAVEAMASGTPPVVSEAVPNEVVIDGYNGLRVRELSPRAFADAVKALLADEDLWRRLSLNGIEFARRFDMIEVAKKYEELIKKLL